MAFRYREDLVGKRFLSVSGVAKINVNKVSEWGWKAGIIRAASLKDNKNKELQTNSTFIGQQVVGQLCLERNQSACVDRKECIAQYIWPLSLCTRAGETTLWICIEYFIIGRQSIKAGAKVVDGQVVQLIARQVRLPPRGPRSLTH
ncbi:hypothetical protein RR48_11820 [Papilio machaon]|uniref:DUF7030 domain-containing protein n=1 Tax=Papilio machaon TaxID=76193 RepID=A0A194QML4_PAPMA|nr:hypothetical protein RR48_11820 [Papilio machaon]